jgi:pimeloyl-ACP methyl ester carboxylesterase
MVHRIDKTIEVINGAEVCISRNEGKPLILLTRMASRGLGGWDGIWDSLLKHFSVGQFDLTMPSVAALERPHDVFKSLARDCVRMAKALGHDSFHILGWTGGAHVALRSAIDWPDRISSCTLLTPFYPMPDARPTQKGSQFMRTLLQGGGRELYTYYWFMAGLSPRFVRENFDEVERLVKHRLEADSFMQADPRQAVAWSQALRGFWATQDELAAIRAPTLIVGADLDPAFIGPCGEMAERLHAAMPQSRLEIARGYGSLLLIEAPEAFAALSDAFFSNVTTVKEARS